MTYAIIDAASFEGRRKLVAQELGASAIRLNRFDNQPGQEGKEHDERASGQEEIYVPVEGSGLIRIGDEEIPLEPGCSCSSRRTRLGRSWQVPRDWPTSSSAPSLPNRRRRQGRHRRLPHAERAEKGVLVRAEPGVRGQVA